MKTSSNFKIRMHKFSSFLCARPVLFTFILALFTGILSYSYWIITNGGTAITKIDSFWQQVPFYRDGWEKAHSGTFVFWSWNNMHGSDYYGSNLFYYIWSPFFRMITLFPKEWIPQMMLVMNILKFTIGATLFAKFLKVLGYKKWYAIVIGGLLYGYSGPMIINIFFNHFNDYFAFFPLLLIAIEYYLRQKNRIWLSFTIAFLAIINPYFIIFTFIIFIIYLVARWLILYPFSWKAFFIEVLQAILYIGLGLGMASFVILPFVIQSSLSPRSGQFNDIKLFWSGYGWAAIIVGIVPAITSIAAFLFPPSRIQSSEPFYNMSIQWQSLAVYAGSLPLLFANQLKYMVQSRTYKIIKYTGIIIVSLLVLPIFNNIVALLTNMNYRWSYLVIAFIIVTTVHVIENFEKINREKLKKTSLLIALTMVVCIALPTLIGPISYNSELLLISFIVRNALPTLLFLIITVFLLLSKKVQNRIWPFLIVLTIIQSTFSTAIFIGYNSAPTGNVVSYDEIEKRQTRSDIINEIVKENNMNQLRDRMWIDELSHTDYSPFAYNQSLYYNVNNQLIYHSLYNTATNKYFDWTHGFTEPQTFWARNVEINQVYFDNLSIDYFITQNPTPTYIPSQFKKVQTKQTNLGTYFVYKNESNNGFFKSYTQTLPEQEIRQSTSLFASNILNDYLIVEDEQKQNENPFTPTLASRKKDEYIKTNKEMLTHIGNLVWTDNLTFTISSPIDYTFSPETTSGDYVFYNTRDITLSINNKKIDTNNSCFPETPQQSTQCLMLSVPFQQGDTVKISFKPTSYSLHSDNRFGFTKNTKEDYERAKKEQKMDYTFTNFNENGFSAQIHVTKENSYTYTPIPFTKGQTFTVDGNITIPERVNGGFIAFKLPPGDHTITMSYISPGFIEGGIISITLLFISACILLFSFYKSKKKR